MAEGRKAGTKNGRRFVPQFGRYILSGILTVIPLWITWIVFDFVFRQFSHLGMPWVRKTLETIKPFPSAVPMPRLHRAVPAGDRSDRRGCRIGE
jgi:uncharacterized membrane protein